MIKVQKACCIEDNSEWLYFTAFLIYIFLKFWSFRVAHVPIPSSRLLLQLQAPLCSALPSCGLRISKPLLIRIRKHSQVWHPGIAHKTKSCNGVQDVLGIKELQNFCHWSGGNNNAMTYIASSIWSTVLFKISKISHKTAVPHPKR